MEIYFVRHTSVAVPSGICYGSTDVDLASTFEEEARKVKRELEGIEFDKVYSSPLSRAVKLASYCGYPDAIQDSRLSEFDFGDWELCSYNELYENVPLFRTWCENYLTVRCPNGESLSDQIFRVKSFIDSVREKGFNRICVFCHGGVLAISRSLSGEKTMEETFKSIPPYGSIIHCIF